MSDYWGPLQMHDKITQILDVQSHELGHHFGRPFMTPYQIAIKFRQNFPNEFNTIGKPVGGRGIGQQDSLAQYIALELSKRIQSGEISNIEGRFLHRDYLDILRYKYDGQEIESSSGQAYDLSMFRRID
ncbi:MAG: hypothetical protein WAK96_05740 [Desulfobaccales bacterium]